MSATAVLPHEALIGNRDRLEPGIGWEPLTRAAAIMLHEHLNDAIDRESARWKLADLQLAALGIDEGVGQVEIPHVLPANIHPGPRRSLIEAPPTKFPNVSVMGYMSVPSSSQFDQFDTSDLTLFVESMAISGPVPDGLELVHETIVHRRIQRMTEAVAAVFRQNPTLYGTVLPAQMPPRGGIGNSSWLRRQDNGAGPRFLWHGSRLQYTLQRHAALA